MKPEVINVLGLKHTILVPESYDEFDNLAKKANAALISAISNERYRGTNAQARDGFCTDLAAATEIKRKYETVTNADGTPKMRSVEGGEPEPIERWTESEGEYVKRVLAELSVYRSTVDHPVEVLISEFQPLMDKYSVGGEKEIVFDPTQAERIPAGPKKLPKNYAEAGQLVLTGMGADPQTGHPIANLSRWKHKHGQHDSKGADWTADSIGWAIKAINDAKNKPEALLAQSM